MKKSALMVRTLNRLVREALAEDIGLGDVTTNNTVPGEDRCHVRLMAKQVGVLSGIEVFRQVFVSAKAEIRDWKALPDGTRFRRGEEAASFTGNARAVLTAERTALNFLQHLSEIGRASCRERV
jgi:nicotinate-nucleotide pyrophosphorylase (carboxylating)